MLPDKGFSILSLAAFEVQPNGHFFKNISRSLPFLVSVDENYRTTVVTNKVGQFSWCVEPF